MSTRSLLYHGFGLRNVERYKTCFKGGVSVLSGRRPLARLVCRKCHSADVVRRGSTQRELRHVPIGVRPVIVDLRIQRLQCRQCGHLGNEHFLFLCGHKRYTRAFADYVARLSACMTVKDLAQHLRVSWGLIRSIQETYLQRKLAKATINRGTLFMPRKISVSYSPIPARSVA